MPELRAISRMERRMFAAVQPGEEVRYQPADWPFPPPGPSCRCDESRWICSSRFVPTSAGFSSRRGNKGSGAGTLPLGANSWRRCRIPLNVAGTRRAGSG